MWYYIDPTIAVTASMMQTQLQLKHTQTCKDTTVEKPALFISPCSIWWVYRGWNRRHSTAQGVLLQELLDKEHSQGKASHALEEHTTGPLSCCEVFFHHLVSEEADMHVHTFSSSLSYITCISYLPINQSLLIPDYCQTFIWCHAAPAGAKWEWNPNIISGIGLLRDVTEKNL
jgi:hypothetical protein